MHRFDTSQTQTVKNSDIDSKKRTPTKENSKTNWATKKRQSTFVDPGKKFFGNNDVKNKLLARKKSTSNFLCNFYIIEQPEKESSKSKTPSDKVSSENSEENEFVAEMGDIVLPSRPSQIQRMDSDDIGRQDMLRKNVSLILLIHE